ncbi:hypothetical protein OE88DRAFT_1698296 [Heliocybe sulcata]|uniref:Telomere-associated protein Rif1 N-terminal domain-containing protein n=1 Tax=Heliocybe sulcata TaxID=5364 RepID=A0A5C3N6M1_9AGAM|nr:hypothetical protein OE88DRAFT_1698296 [Heliocybe sulcata]
MSLLTPPATSHRDKENRPPPGASGSRVAWSQQNQYHSLPSSPEPYAAAAIPPKNPVKSILKKSSQPILPFQNEDVRETTPLPDAPMQNASYLLSAVSRIIAVASSMRDIIEGYSVLSVRIRDHVDDDAFGASQCPLLQPVRDNRDALAEAVVRDLGRALVHPPTMDTTPGPGLKRMFGLPSPKASPKKKKSMNEEQVTYARDLATTCHAVIRFLAVVWTKPSVSSLFTERQISEMLTALLCIPLEPQLPTPNARKTCALSIWLIQAQRLPEEILYPAKDRIAYAIRRGIEGELGKEGKKGSVNDGYKAIHDLSIHLPTVFIPAFTELLPSLFAGLLGPTVVMRAQACNALGGFVRGSASLPRMPIHTKISALVEDFLTTPSTALRKSPSPSKLPSESAIVRTLRTTLNATEPAHAAQGPVWALCVLASVIVLLGPALSTEAQLFRIMSAMLSLALRHKKSSIRALLCAVWPCMTHAFFQPPLIKDPDEAQDNSDSEEGQAEEDTSQNEKNREALWKLVKNMVDMGAGVTTIATALIADEEEDVKYTRLLTVLNQMVHKGGLPCEQAVEVLERLSNLGQVADDHEPVKLLSPGLFSCLGGLLAVDWKSVVNAVRPLFDDLPKIDAIRPLTRDELSDGRLFQGLIDIWKVALLNAEIPGDQHKAPDAIVSAWAALLQAKVSIIQDDGDHDGLLEFSDYIVEVLVEILRDAEIDFTARPATSKSSTISIELPKVFVKSNRSRATLRLLMVRNLWTSFRSMVPREDLSAATGQLVACLKQDRALIIGDEKAGVLDEGAWSEWGTLCAQTLAVCDIDDLKAFWAHVSEVCPVSWPGEARGLAWENFTNEWFSDKANTRESAMVLLSVPFSSSTPWDMSESELRQWHQCCLSGASDMAYDAGEDYTAVLNDVVDAISRAHWSLMTSGTSPARIADILLQSFGSSDATSIPHRLFEFVNDTLLTSYPPAPRNKVICTWLIRTFVRSVEECQSDLLVDMLEAVAEGLALWIADEHKVFSQDEYALDLLPLYQTILVAVGALPPSLEVLDRLLPIIHAPFLANADDMVATTEAFSEFWRGNCSHLPIPEGGWPAQLQECRVAARLQTSEPAVYIGQRVGDEADDGYEADTSFNAEVETSSKSQTDDADDELLTFPESDEEKEVHSLLSEVPASPARKRPSTRAVGTSPSRLGSSNRVAITTPPASTEDGDSGHERPSPPLTALRSRQSTAESKMLSEPPTTPINARTAQETPTRAVSAMSFYASSPFQRKANNENVSPSAAVSSGSEEKSPGKRQRAEDTEDPNEVDVAVGSIKTKRARFSATPTKYPLTATDRKERRAYSIQSKSSPGSRSVIPVVLKDKGDPFTSPKSKGSAANSEVTASSMSAIPATPSRLRSNLVMEAVVIPPFHCNKDHWLDISPLSSAKKRRGDFTRSPSYGGVVKSGARVRVESARSKKIKSVRVQAADLTAVPDSDDLPALSSNMGQVTPHHVVSPIIRRKQIFMLNDDLPSDDSDMGSSPIKVHTARKELKRSSSVNEARPSFPAMS